jgi:hypothetical protein
LLIDIIFLITRKGSDDVDSLVCEKPGKVGFTLHLKHCQIASVNHLTVPCPTFLNQILKMWVHLRGATGYIYGGDGWTAVENIQDLIHGGFAHTFRSLGTGINMAMVAGLVTDFPDIDLKRGNGVRLKGKQMMDGHRLFKRGSQSGSFGGGDNG